MPDQADRPGHGSGLDRLNEALALKVLASIEVGGLDEVNCKLDRLLEVIVRAHRAEMANVDEESNRISAELDEVTKAVQGEQAAALIPRLNKIRDNLKALGRIEGQPGPRPGPETR